MKTITFDVKKRNQIALEMDDVIPDKIYSWEAEDFDKYAVPVGNSRFPITDFFDITVEGTADSPAEVKMIFNGDCGRVKYIGNKMSAGEIIVNGDADLHVGAEMSGGAITVHGNCEAHAGREMTGGTLEIFGNTKEFTGASYIGEWRGMRGGKITVHGNAGKQCGECLVGGHIHVKGDCDILAGIHMRKGLIEIDGNVNRWPGGQMKNGNIIIRGRHGRLLEGFVEEEIVTNTKIKDIEYDDTYIKYKEDNEIKDKVKLYKYTEKKRDKLSE